MDNKIEIWNVLHDGEISAISGEKTETLTMFVSIPYLRRRFEPLGDSFILTIKGLKEIEFKDFDGEISSLREEMDIGEVEIFAAKTKSMPVIIDTSMGQLKIDFDEIEIKKDNGEIISFEEIEKVCIEYWEELNKRNA